MHCPFDRAPAPRIPHSSPVAEPDLASKIVALDVALRAANAGHAFGGALALAYYAEPRATRDIDVNVFIPPERHGVVDNALVPLGVAPVENATQLLHDGQVRMWWGSTPVDVFFAYDRFHEAMARQVRQVPFGQHTLPILAPEHLIVCKVAFNRPKDWLDIEQVLRGTRGLRGAEVRRWLAHVVGTGDPRATRYAALVADVRRSGHGYSAS